MTLCKDRREARRVRTLEADITTHHMLVSSNAHALGAPCQATLGTRWFSTFEMRDWRQRDGLAASEAAHSSVMSIESAPSLPLTLISGLIPAFKDALAAQKRCAYSTGVTLTWYRRHTHYSCSFALRWGLRRCDCERSRRLNSELMRNCLIWV